MLTVGIFGPPDDREVQALSSRIVNRGGAVRNIDLSRFPQDMTIEIRPDAVLVDHRSVFELDAAFLRKRGVTVPHYIDYEKKCTVESPQEWQELYPDYCVYLENEVRVQSIRNTVIELTGQSCRLVNSAAANDLHRKKTGLLWHLRKSGLPVPDFVCGTDRAFLQMVNAGWEQAGRGTVIKPLAGIYKTLALDDTAAAHHPWDKRPAFYQHYIRGETIRCYVLDGRVMAAAIIVHGNTVDSSMSQTGIEVIMLPAEAERIAVHTAHVLGIDFCGLDLMRNEAGSYFLIDCNFSPMFVNFSLASCIDIPALLADFLLAAAAQKKKQSLKTLSLLQEAKSLLAGDPDIRKKLLGK